MAKTTIPALEDNIYDEVGTRAMKAIIPGEVLDRTPDQNIFEWYQNVLKDNTNDAPTHIIDWGAGVGRFVPLFQKCGVKTISLIEPSTSSHEHLKATFGSDKNISIINAQIGAQIERTTTTINTVHICTFVVNCLPNLTHSFDLFAQSIHSGERLFIITNTFAPKNVVNTIANCNAANAIEINVSNFMTDSGKLPTTTKFKNKIVATGQILTDSVHTLYEYSKLLPKIQNSFQIIKAELMLPDGFVHETAIGDNFGDQQFAVLAIQLVRN